MVEIKLTVANDDLDTVEAYLQQEIKRMAGMAVASVPTRKTERATTVYVMLMGMRNQIKDFRALLAEKERAAREARKGKRGA